MCLERVNKNHSRETASNFIKNIVDCMPTGQVSKKRLRRGNEHKIESGLYTFEKKSHTGKPARQSAFKYVISAFWFVDDREVSGKP